ncbi:hypothetical protein [Bradyrhizobium sp.]|uniref:hypothetical protein n=1 Tax=Bradyrhizobium sp. TaxID=376 RepID=UPI0039E65B31
MKKKQASQVLRPVPQADQPATKTQIAVIDPDNVQETLTIGPYNATITSNMVTLTFTHTRLDIANLMKEAPALVPVNVVRARLVMPIGSVRNLIATLGEIVKRADAENNSTQSKSAH